jgi:hypothetical protein
VIEIKNLLFQPLTFHLAGGRGLHLNPRERKTVAESDISPEIEAAAKRNLISLSQAKPPGTSSANEKRPAKVIEAEKAAEDPSANKKRKRLSAGASAKAGR